MRGKAQIYIAGLLTWIAGFVDAVGFLAIGGIYTANMSGNSVAIGIHGWEQNWIETARRAWPVAIYVLGLLSARILLEIAGRERVRSVAAIAFGIEIAALAPATFAHALSKSEMQSPLAFGLIALLAFAMGIQNATLTHFSSLTLHTGFVTGTLLKMAEQFVKYLTWSFDQLRQEHVTVGRLLRSTGSQQDFQRAALLGSMWTAYVVGAVCGSAGKTMIGLQSLFTPIVLLLFMALYDLRQPIAAKDEKEQLQLP